MAYVRRLFLICLTLLAGDIAAHGQIQRFEHVIVIVQENRTPDNLFQGLCVIASSCSTKPTGNQYNIQTHDWLDKKQPTGVIQPLPVPLASTYDLNHTHGAFMTQCDLNAKTGQCRMDGGAKVTCTGKCLTQPQFRYVDDSTGTLDPYLRLAREFGWANYMFQTNQGPSFPAHQFLFGGTSAPIAADDAAGIFVAENLSSGATIAGCIALPTTTVAVISPPGVENQVIYPCFEHETIPDILPAGLTWRYYSPSAGSIWTAPDAINHICQPDQPTGGKCGGTGWKDNVDLWAPDALTDIAKCNLRSVSWIVPSGQNSDHAGINVGGGPAWVASIVNAIGQSKCKNPDGSSYWHSTAILITWDDWGGWYDHEPPTFLPQPGGDYQYGFRVPLIVVSAYTGAGQISNLRLDFGTLLRFIERNFGTPQGALNFADARATTSLTDFFDLTRVPRPFVPIAAAKSAAFFINDHTPPTDPDDD